MPDRTSRALDMLLEVARRQVERHLTAYAQDLDADAFGERMLDTLFQAHARATYLGRYRAGDTAPPDADDQRFAEQVLRGEDRFLAGFVEDLAAGKYHREGTDFRVDAARRRALMYVERVRGTANETWALASGGLIHWRLGEPETGHCTDCPELAARGPYLWNALPAAPKDGSTECLVNCLCWLEAENGTTSFPA